MLMEKEDFQDCVKWRMGSRDIVSFWRDEWMEGGVGGFLIH